MSFDLSFAQRTRVSQVKLATETSGAEEVGSQSMEGEMQERRVRIYGAFSLRTIGVPG